MSTTDEFSLPPEGRDYALRIIRAHRLWEEYLAEETGFSEADWYDHAEYFEHHLSPEEAQALAAHLGNPTYDPHGDPIPTTSGEFIPHAGKPLTTLPVDAPLRIVHIEDEPEAVYAQLVAEGLFPGMNARLTEVTLQRVRLWAGGDEHILAPVVAANISAVALVEAPAAKPDGGIPLSDLRLGETRGMVKADTGFGNITIKNAENDPAIEHQKRCDQFRGSLGEGPHTVHSDFGDIEIAIPADTALNVDFKTDFGRIRSDLPVTMTPAGDLDQTHQAGTINRGGSELSASTKSGNITFSALGE